MSARKPPNLSANPSATSRLVLPGALVLATVTLIVAAPKDHALKPQSLQDNAPKTGVNAPKKATGIANGPVLEEKAKPESKGRRPLEFYTQNARTGMFSEPLPPAPKPIIVKPAPPAPPPKPAEVDPFTGWSYTGTVTVNGEKMALLENAQTKEGQYLRVGEMFLGGQVSDVSVSHIAISIAGQTRQISKSQALNLVPLSANAPASGGQPFVPVPTGQPMNAGGPISGMGGGSVRIISPNGVEAQMRSRARNGAIQRLQR